MSFHINTKLMNHPYFLRAVKKLYSKQKAFFAFNLKSLKTYEDSLNIRSLKRRGQDPIKYDYFGIQINF